MGTFGVLDARGGGAVALVFVVATVAMSFTAWSYARMSAAVPRAGSVYAYASAGLGPRPGFLAGWMIALDYLFIPSVASLFAGIACHALVPAVPVWVFTLAAVVLVTALNLGGVKARRPGRDDGAGGGAWWCSARSSSLPRPSWSGTGRSAAGSPR